MCEEISLISVRKSEHDALLKEGIKSILQKIYIYQVVVPDFEKNILEYSKNEFKMSIEPNIFQVLSANIGFFSTPWEKTSYVFVSLAFIRENNTL